MSIQAINSRNQFKGTIKEIVPGPVVSEVDVETPAGIVTSVITSRSISDLQLRVGSKCWRWSNRRRCRSRRCRGEGHTHGHHSLFSSASGDTQRFSWLSMLRHSSGTV